MKLAELRRRVQQRLASRPGVMQHAAQQITVFSDRRKKGAEIGLQFVPAFTGDYITMSADQAYNHGLTVLAGAIACGAKHKATSLEAKVEEIGQAMDRDEKAQRK